VPAFPAPIGVAVGVIAEAQRPAVDAAHSMRPISGAATPVVVIVATDARLRGDVAIGAVADVVAISCVTTKRVGTRQPVEVVIAELRAVPSARLGLPDPARDRIADLVVTPKQVVGDCATIGHGLLVM